MFVELFIPVANYNRWLRISKRGAGSGMVRGARCDSRHQAQLQPRAGPSGCAATSRILAANICPFGVTKIMFSTADLSDAAPEARAIGLQFFNYGQQQQFGGSVVTIKCHEDNSLVKQCVQEPGQGRVIVVDGGSSERRALLGDMLAAEAAANAWAGLVIAGVIRDVDAIGRTPLGVQALGSCPIKTEKLGMGQRDIAIVIGGVLICPGDYVYADNDGVLVSKQPLL